MGLNRGEVANQLPNATNAKGGGNYDDVNAQLNNLNRRLARSVRAQEENLQKIIKQKR